MAGPSGWSSSFTCLLELVALGLARAQFWAQFRYLRGLTCFFRRGTGGRKLFKDEGLGWCRRRGSNPHDRKDRGILSPVRLPIPPLRH
jgi:hypothetical protein